MKGEAVMQRIDEDVYVTIEECGAQAQVVIPPLELNEIRRERNEYLAQTASDLYDRVVFMIRSQSLEYDPALDEDEGPLVTLEVRMGNIQMSSAFWLEERRARQEKLKVAINELFMLVLNMRKNLDDIIREEEEEDAKKK
jgi:hypothetical protein